MLNRPDPESFGVTAQTVNTDIPTFVPCASSSGRRFNNREIPAVAAATPHIIIDRCPNINLPDRLAHFPLLAGAAPPLPIGYRKTTTTTTTNHGETEKDGKDTFDGRSAGPPTTLLRPQNREQNGRFSHRRGCHPRASNSTAGFTSLWVNFSPPAPCLRQQHLGNSFDSGWTANWTAEGREQTRISSSTGTATVQAPHNLALPAHCSWMVTTSLLVKTRRSHLAHLESQKRPHWKNCGVSCARRGYHRTLFTSRAVRGRGRDNSTTTADVDKCTSDRQLRIPPSR